MIITRKIGIRGSVVGIGFRYFLKAKAISLGIKGYAKNITSTKIEVMAQGETESVKKFVDYCQKGPVNSKVQTVDIEKLDTLELYKTFDIK